MLIIYIVEILLHILDFVEAVFADGCVLELLKVFVVSAERAAHMVFFQQNTLVFVEYLDAVAEIQAVLCTDRFWDNDTSELVNF